MEQKKMSKEEEIRDSLEACRDIYRYYKDDSVEKGHIHPARHSSFRTEAYRQGSSRREQSVQLSQLMESDMKDESRKSFLKNALSFLLCVVVAAGLALAVSTYLVQPTMVEGISMEPALKDGEYLLMDKISYRIREPERFDVVIFPFEEDVYYIKRIIGLPGETVRIKDGQVYINGNLLTEDSYGPEAIRNPGRAEQEILLGEGEYFVLGDNRNESLDSRYEVVGNISGEEILGKAFFRVLPLKSFGWIDKGVDTNDIDGRD